MHLILTHFDCITSSVTPSTRTIITMITMMMRLTGPMTRSEAQVAIGASIIADAGDTILRLSTGTKTHNNGNKVSQDHLKNCYYSFSFGFIYIPSIILHKKIYSSSFYATASRWTIARAQNSSMMSFN